MRAVTRENARALARLERQFVRVKLQASRAAQAPPAARASMAPDAIRALRGKQSRKAFARKLRVSPGSIFGWETGRTIPRGRNVARLANLKKKVASAKRTAPRGSRRHR